MKPSRILLSAIGVTASLMLAASASADGGGRIVTPYRDLYGPGPVSTDRIECEMQMASMIRYIHNYDVSWPSGVFGGLQQVGMAFLNVTRAEDLSDQRYTAAVFHFFEGKDPNDQPVRVDFNRIEAFEIMDVHGNAVRLRVTVFPTTSVETIAANRLSYSDLKKDKSSVIVTIATQNVRDEKLAFVELDGQFLRSCTDRSQRKDQIRTQMEAVRFRVPPTYTGPIIKKFAPLVNMKPAQYDASFTGDDAWWAVPSVTADSAYPHRTLTKK
jgi:hypothetical protein